MIGDEVEEKNLTSEGRGAQYLLAGSAIALAGIGTYFLAAECSQQNGQPCSPDDQASRTAKAGILLGSGIASVAMFGINAARVQDSGPKIIPVAPQTGSTKWASCEVEKPEGLLVKLFIGGEILQAETDEDGVAEFDLSTFSPSLGLEKQAIVQAQTDQSSVDVDLSSLLVFPVWRKQLLAQRTTLESDNQAREEKVRAEAAARKARDDALVQKCNGGDAMACFRAAEVEASGRVAPWYKEACALKLQIGCVEYQRLVDQHTAQEARRILAEAQATRRSVASSSSSQDPWEIAKEDLLDRCVRENGGGAIAESVCLKRQEIPVYKQMIGHGCQSICETRKMDDCYSKCRIKY